jgi:hypothetical protein
MIISQGLGGVATGLLGLSSIIVPPLSLVVLQGGREANIAVFPAGYPLSVTDLLVTRAALLCER